MATELGAYAGKVIHIDLSSETVREYPWPDRLRKTYLGGKIMAFRIMADLLTGKENPFSDENPVILSTGPLTGTGAPGSHRFDITAISPLTGLPASSNCGGNLGVYLKKAGFDALILTGRCKSRCWLEIRDDDFIFHNADMLWGTRAGECQTRLTELLGTPSFGRLCIGPAGENLVKYACVCTEGKAAGRSGIGAVLGWKNLKAITVTTNGAISLHDPEGCAEISRQWHQTLAGQAKPDASGYRCTGCPLRCKKSQPNETGLALDDLGMDAVAAMETIQWAKAAHAHGIWNQSIPADISQLLTDIALNRGIGTELGEGVRFLRQKYDFSPENPAGHRSGNRRAGGYRNYLNRLSLNPRTLEEQAACAVAYLNLTEAISAAGLCMLMVNGLCPDLPHHLPMLRRATGMDMDSEKFLAIGNLSYDLERALLLRFSDEPLQIPKLLSGVAPEVYFRIRGWDENGVPTSHPDISI